MRVGSEGVFDVGDLSDGDLSSLTTLVIEERLRRSVAEHDPDVIARQALQELFSGGVPSAPRVYGNSIIALPGVINDVSAKRHECKLFTVVLGDGGPEEWSWSETVSTFLFNDHDKVGKLRRSVNLHAAVDGMTLVQHAMTKPEKGRHARQGCRAWRVDHVVDEETGEITATRVVALPDYTPSHLPPPHGAEDTRSFVNRDG